MKKSEALEHWRNLEPNQPIMPEFNPIPYKAKGSTYGACGIRIDGTPEFIDAVLSHLQELIQGEGETTRLGLARNPVNGEGLNKSFSNREQGAEVCYIRLHERGDESKMYHAITKRGARAAYAELFTNAQLLGGVA